VRPALLIPLTLCACVLDLERTAPQHDAAPRDLPAERIVDSRVDAAVDLPRPDALVPRQWHRVSRDIGDDLRAVHGAGSAIWIVGGPTVFHRRADGSWADPETLPGTSRLTGVWAASADQGWIVDDAGTTGAIFALTREGWLRQQLTTTDLSAIWGRSATEIWAGGDQALVLHFDGDWAISHDANGTDNTQIEDIWGSSSTDVWAVRGVRLLHFVEGDWTSEGSFPELKGIWGRSANEIWAVGDEILRYDGQGWTPQTKPGTESLHDIWGCPDGEL
jgi:hypothetical protein